MPEAGAVLDLGVQPTLIHLPPLILRYRRGTRNLQVLSDVLGHRMTPLGNHLNLALCAAHTKFSPQKAAKKQKPSVPDPSPEIMEKGRMYGCYIDMFGLIKPVLEHGMVCDPDAADELYTSE